MKTKYNVLTKSSLISGCALALAFASGCATNSTTGNQMKPMKAGEHQLMLNKIETAQDFVALQNDDTFDGVRQMQNRVDFAREARGEGR